MPGFRSREVKRGGHQRAPSPRSGSRLPLVGGPALALALLGGWVTLALLRASPASPWPFVAAGGFFAFGLVDDAAKTIRGRGIGEGVYFASMLALSVAAVALLVGSGTHAAGSGSPYALAAHLGPGAHLPLSAWYLALILGTTLAVSFSDGMDGLTAGAAAVLMTGAALIAGPLRGAWAGVLAAGAAGALAWNLPSRWAPSARQRPRRARAYLGDSGALTLGAGMAAAAIAAGVDLLWPLIAGPLLLEGFASLVQSKLLVPAWRRFVDPRAADGTPLPYQRFPLPLLAAPLHYHWELLGMDRLTIVRLFWTTTGLATAAGSGAALAGHPMLAAALLAAAGGVGLAFWLAAAWLRPAFLRARGGAVHVMHGRPWRAGPLPLWRRRMTIHDPAVSAAAANGGLLERPMNAHELDAWLDAARQTGPHADA